MRTVPLSRSTSDQCNPQTSDLRRPSMSTITQSAYNR
jgi:hypothetical protein